MTAGNSANDAGLESIATAVAPDRPVKTIRPPSITPAGLFRSILELIRYRDLLYTLALHRIKVRYKQSALGPAWAILQPVSLMLMYTLIFSKIARIPTDGVPYSLFAFAGLLPWLLFATSVTSSTMGITSHADLIRKVFFPREILPLTYVFAALLDFLVSSVLLLGLMIWYAVPVSSVLLFAVPLLIIELAIATAVSMLFCAIQVRMRDIGIAMPLLLQLWMFATPVVYPLTLVPERIRWFFALNPLSGIVEGFRAVVLRGQPPDWTLLSISSATAFGLLAISYAVFKHVEATMADNI